jgi:hypothetical protein
MDYILASNDKKQSCCGSVELNGIFSRKLFLK